jgi:translocator protein
VARFPSDGGAGFLIGGFAQKMFEFRPKNTAKYHKNMNNFNWYSQLTKPYWAPPSWLFGPVWTVLYILIFVSFGYVFVMFFQKKIAFFVLLPFLLNLIFNFSFTPLQFGLKNNFLASLDILLVLGTLVWAMLAIFPHMRWIAYIQIPYLIWVFFASILQLSITFLNR